MVDKKKALKASAISAGVVGLVHYLAHSYGLEWQIVGIIVVSSTFALAYWGMTRK